LIINVFIYIIPHFDILYKNKNIGGIGISYDMNQVE